MSETNWKFYLSPREAITGMYVACQEARFSIDFEQYIFEDNFQGRKFLELLVKKAEAGVRVRLLCDAVGSRSLYSSPVLSEVIRRGVQARFFNPIEPWWIHRLFTRFLRTHRKLLITDSQHGFIGGVGIRAYTVARRDTHVRVTGPVVDEMLSAFERMWEKTDKGERIFKFKRPIIEGSEFMLLTNSPYYRQRFTYRALLKMFRTARKYIYLTTPYFVPDWRLLRALRGAARRGVDVRLLVPASPDWKLVRFANRSFYGRAFRSGIRVYEYGPLFNHAKTCVIDDTWACVGSSNLDSLSLLLNYEADLASTNKEFIAELKWHFIEDSKSARQITRREWNKRPLLARVMEVLVSPLHRLM